MRVFLDTNVLVSAFASRGLCAALFEVVLLDHELILGRNVLRELERALRAKVRLPAVRASEIVGFVAGEAASVVETADAAKVKVEASDALVLGEARSGLAEVFVTGDGALLRLASVGELKIVSPRQFWDVLRAERT
ncbi:MAG: putative toxin-antitoxin system toxin component, PIN family [Gaiella sp.]